MLVSRILSTGTPWWKRDIALTEFWRRSNETESPGPRWCNDVDCVSYMPSTSWLGDYIPFRMSARVVLSLTLLGLLIEP